MTAKTLRALLDKQQLSSADKSKINKAYLAAYGNKPLTASNCENCYHDALIELLSATIKGDRLRAGEVVEYEGKFYNRHDYPLPAAIVKMHRDKLE